MTRSVNAWANEWLGLIVLVAAVLTPAAAFVGVDILGPGVKIERIMLDHVRIDKRVDSTNAAMNAAQQVTSLAVAAVAADTRDQLTFRCVETPISRLRDAGLFRLAARCERLLQTGSIEP